MKKYVSLILIIAMLISVFSCKKAEETEIIPATLAKPTESAADTTEEDISQTDNTQVNEVEKAVQIDKTDNTQENANNTEQTEEQTEPEIKQENTDNITENAKEDQPAVQNETTDDTDDTGIMISSILPEMSMEEMIGKSSLIVLGEYQKATDCISIAVNDYAFTTNYTNHLFTVNEVLYGDLNEAEITVRVEGGETELYYVVNLDAPKFTSGEKYLLFLYNPGNQISQNTSGDHYFIVGVNRGVMKQVEVQDSQYYVGEYGKTDITKDNLDTDADQAVVEYESFKEILADINTNSSLYVNNDSASTNQTQSQTFEYAAIVDKVYFD